MYYIEEEEIQRHLSAKPFRLVSEVADELQVEAYVIVNFIEGANL